MLSAAKCRPSNFTSIDCGLLVSAYTCVWHAHLKRGTRRSSYPDKKRNSIISIIIPPTKILEVNSNPPPHQLKHVLRKDFARVLKDSTSIFRIIPGHICWLRQLTKNCWSYLGWHHDAQTLLRQAYFFPRKHGIEGKYRLSSHAHTKPYMYFFIILRATIAWCKNTDARPHFELHLTEGCNAEL